MTQNTRIINRFTHHLEDLDCSDCLFYTRNNKHFKNGCGRVICAFWDIRADAVAQGRIKRKRGWFKCSV